MDPIIQKYKEAEFFSIHYIHFVSKKRMGGGVTSSYLSYKNMIESKELAITRKR